MDPPYGVRSLIYLIRTLYQGKYVDGSIHVEQEQARPQSPILLLLCHGSIGHCNLKKEKKQTAKYAGSNFGYRSWRLLEPVFRFYANTIKLDRLTFDLLKPSTRRYLQHMLTSADTAVYWKGRVHEGGGERRDRGGGTERRDREVITASCKHTCRTGITLNILFCFHKRTPTYML